MSMWISKTAHDLCFIYIGLAKSFYRVSKVTRCSRALVVVSRAFLVVF